MNKKNLVMALIMSSTSALAQEQLLNISSYNNLSLVMDCMEAQVKAPHSSFSNIVVRVNLEFRQNQKVLDTANVGNYWIPKTYSESSSVAACRSYFSTKNNYFEQGYTSFIKEKNALFRLIKSQVSIVFKDARECTCYRKNLKITKVNDELQINPITGELPEGIEMVRLGADCSGDVILEP